MHCNCTHRKHIFSCESKPENPNERNVKIFKDGDCDPHEITLLDQGINECKEIIKDKIIVLANDKACK